MSQAILEPADKRTGIFIHVENKDEASFAVGSLWIDTQLGVRAEIPYFGFAGDEFATPRRWFGEHEAPRNLLFRSDHLSVSLFGCQIIGVATGSHLDVGRFRVREAVFEEDVASLDRDLRVTMVVSHLDGLAEWAGLSSVEWKFERNDAPRQHEATRVVYTVERREGLTWLQGAARMKLVTHTRPGGRDRGIHLTDDTVLKSRFHEPRPISEHLNEHRKFRNLLSLILGSGAHFRSHSVRDERFPIRTLDGKSHGADYSRVIAASTVSDHYMPLSERNGRDWPILSVEAVSPVALARWARDYDRSLRFVLPAASMLQRSALMVEDKVINASMSIEAIGQAMGYVSGEEPTLSGKKMVPTTATYFYRVIETTGVDASPISVGRVDLARALAETYNRTKHADRGDFPDTVHMSYAGRLSSMSRVPWNFGGGPVIVRPRC